MQLGLLDISIVVGYIILLIGMGWALSKRASQDLDNYFLGGRSLPWWIIGTSHGASGFDITGTMWFVAMLYTYGIKAAWIPWVWPLFDRVFRQVYLGAWIRRSNVLTGAEWMRTRFGDQTGGKLSHISVVIYALVATVGFLAYAFQGIGKFAEVFFPWNLGWAVFSSADSYAIIILLLTLSYLLLGGWYSVVLTDLLQFALLTVASVGIAVIAMRAVSSDQLSAAVPDGWSSLWLTLGPIDLDWSEIMPRLNEKVIGDGYSFFGIVIMTMLFRGLLVSMAGPTPGYGIQHVLSTRNPREAALENWWMSIVQLIPRFLMISGIAVLGLVFFSTEIRKMIGMGDTVQFDFEQILPLVMRDFIPAGLVGILLAGLLAAFMSTFDSTVNSGAAYLVNDVYKRYLKPDAAAKTYVRAGYACSALLVVLAIVVGMRVESIHSITGWITAALYGGYVAPNILKWHWWRFNGYGYFGGMVAGVIAAITLPFALKWIDPDYNALIAFPLILALSATASIVVCLMTPPESDEVLESFYRNVRPWGFWRPVHERMARKNPMIRGNDRLALDWFNIAIGIVWQLQLMILPTSLVIREYKIMIGSAIILAITSIIMKFTWYDQLGQQGTIDDTPETEAI